MKVVESALLAGEESPCFSSRKQCTKHAGLKHSFILVLVVSMVLFETLFARRAIAAFDLVTLLSNSMSR